MEERKGKSSWIVSKKKAGKVKREAAESKMALKK
jgi:hypothetical protein